MKFSFRFFYTTSVDSIVNSINRQIAKLEAAASQHDKVRCAKHDAADKLRDEADAHTLEVNRARKVAANLRKLIA